MVSYHSCLRDLRLHRQRATLSRLRYAHPRWNFSRPFLHRSPLHWGRRETQEARAQPPIVQKLPPTLRLSDHCTVLSNSHQHLQQAVLSSRRRDHTPPAPSKGASRGQLSPPCLWTPGRVFPAQEARGKSSPWLASSARPAQDPL